MDISSTLAFAAAMFVLAASPGPGVFAVTTRSLTAGFGTACAMIAGVVLGDIIFMLAAVYGLAALAKNMSTLFVVIKYAGAAYLIYLGLKLLFSRPAAGNAPPAPSGKPSRKSAAASFISGLTVTLGNPKAIFFYLSFLPTFMDLRTITPAGVLTACCVIITVLGGVMAGYAWAADRAGRMFTNSTAVTRINRTAGGVMAAAGVALALKD